MHPSSRSTSRALVLGGGGSTGNAWLIGLVAGLATAGVDVTPADVTVGTSAGATAAVQFAGSSPADLYAATLEPVPPRHRPPAGGAAVPVTDHLARVRGVIAASVDPADMRRRMGASASALLAASDGSWQQRWRDTVAARLPVSTWPERSLRLIAVDADTGDPVVFDRESGVDLVDAVAASCSGGMPYRIGTRRFVDGGYRRNENADLAAGCSRVLVLSPLGGRSLHPPAWGMQLATQVAELRAAGALVETVVPEPDASHLFGENGMDLSLRPAAARAGHAQGVALAPHLRVFWG